MYIVYCSADVYDTYTKYNPADVRWDILNHTMSQYNLHYNHILWLNCVHKESVLGLLRTPKRRGGWVIYSSIHLNTSVQKWYNTYDKPNSQYRTSKISKLTSSEVVSHTTMRVFHNGQRGYYVSSCRVVKEMTERCYREQICFEI